MARQRPLAAGFIGLFFLCCSPATSPSEMGDAADCSHSGPVHLAQIAMDHAFSGKYSVVVHRSSHTSSCDFSSDDPCDVWPDCTDEKVEVRNAACGFNPEIEWRDPDVPWKVVINQATHDPIQLAVFRDTSLLWQGSVELTFPGPTDCEFSPFAVTPKF